MNRLAALALIPLASLQCSCALIGKVIQTPIRLLQAGVRTVTDVQETTPPATREAGEVEGLALRVTEREPAPK